jgi:hypothetical protein
MSSVRIFNDYLPGDVFDNLQNVMMSSDFPWHWTSNISTCPDTNNQDRQFQFLHPFLIPETGLVSPYMQLLWPLVNKIHPAHILRIKANLNVNNSGKQLGYFHVDQYVKESKTAIFYVNTNDGYTEFDTGETVNSIANRLVVFDSDTKHVGYGSTECERRVLINLNYVL